MEGKLMAEIKSTLDIIMEKTEGLTLTEEEKAVIHDKELAGKIRRFFQRYLDGAISMEKFREEWDTVRKEQEKALGILTRLCVEHMEPEGENRSLLTLLDQVAGVEIGSIREILERTKAEIEAERFEELERVRMALAEKGISGSAVRPNLHADPQWKETVSRVRQRLHGTLLSLVPK
jgi:hypothetical protein